MNVSLKREQRVALASYLAQQRDVILQAWRDAVDSDSELSTASKISRAQFNDQIPKVLRAFERELCAGESGAGARAEEREGAAEHGLHRWQQGYDQRETMREWGHLHLCVLDAIERYGALHPELEPDVMPHAQRALVRLCNASVCESAARFTLLQRAEAASRVRELEQALEQLTLLGRQRADTWREAAHDLRGSVNVISTAAAALNREDIPDPTRSEFSDILRKGIVSLREFLSDLMSLARLEAGHDRRNVEAVDAGLLMREFCDAVRPLAAERGLFLKADGPESLLIEGDGAKVRRIAQNLVLNALHATTRGGITVSWQEGASGVEQWILCVQDSGPGFKSDSAPPLLRALKEATDEAHGVEERAEIAGDPSANTIPMPALASQSPARSPHDLQGEGIGLSIVKRLCELLDASLELDSATGKGTTVRVVFPRAYAK